MVLQIYSIYDRKAKIYSEPFLSQNKAVAERRFNYLMKNSQMVAGDCELWYLGVFDNQTGCISSESAEFVCDYSEVDE